jgi:hypothetical protein
MLSPMGSQRSIFTPATSVERQRNFDDYLAFTLGRDGDILEAERDLVRRRERLVAFRDNPVRARRPLARPELFHRNHAAWKDDPAAADRKTLLLTSIYTLARHEWIGISAAWDACASLSPSSTTMDRISRYHLAEEFCHMRLFEEMFRTLHLGDVVWIPLGPVKQRLYRLFPVIPDAIKDPPAFVSELLGLTFYRHVDALLDDVLADEPEARQRIRELLREIMVDELAHVGQRRNFLGPMGTRVARAIVPPFFRAFLRDIPEAPRLFDVARMVEDGMSFDYGSLPDGVLEQSWMPSYCRRG